MSDRDCPAIAVRWRTAPLQGAATRYADFRREPDAGFFPNGAAFHFTPTSPPQDATIRTVACLRRMVRSW